MYFSYNRYPGKGSDFFPGSFVLPRKFILLRPTKALKVPRHLSTQRQISGIEPFDLLDTGPSVLGEVEDIDLPVTENNPHTDCRVAE